MEKITEIVQKEFEKAFFNGDSDEDLIKKTLSIQTILEKKTVQKPKKIASVPLEEYQLVESQEYLAKILNLRLSHLHKRIIDQRDKPEEEKTDLFHDHPTIIASLVKKLGTKTIYQKKTSFEIQETYFCPGIIEKATSQPIYGEYTESWQKNTETAESQSLGKLYHHFFRPATTSTSQYLHQIHSLQTKPIDCTEKQTIQQITAHPYTLSMYEDRITILEHRNLYTIFPEQQLFEIFLREEKFKL